VKAKDAVVYYSVLLFVASTWPFNDERGQKLRDLSHYNGIFTDMSLVRSLDLIDN
jgi:hypothetical protein